MPSASNLLKRLINVREIYIDNAIFKLHYKLTVLFLAVFSIVVAAYQFLGDPIDCSSSAKGELTDNTLDNFCWIHSTYVLPSAWYKEVGIEVAHPGIGEYIPGKEKFNTNYYRWVPYFLFLAAVLFYLPRYIWKSIEGRKMEQIIMGIGPLILDDNTEKEININKLAIYLEQRLGTNTMYALGFVLCEVFNFANVVGQIYFTNTFLGGKFTTYGTEVLEFTHMDQANRTDPMIQVFPRVTMCTYREYGSSGSIQNNEALCLLPINIINEKIFIFLWFWYIILSVTTGVALLYRFALLASNKLRAYVLYYTTSRYVAKNSLYFVLVHGNYGDWFVLNLLEKNIDTVYYCELIEELNRQYNQRFEHDKYLSMRIMQE